MIRRFLCWLVRRLFCVHEWKLKSSDRLDVMRNDLSKEGTVVLTLFECHKCEKPMLVIHNRTHLPAAKKEA
jgi:5-enolpyruvylshikimate-3-phosphate synthase